MKKGLLLMAFINACAFTYAQDWTVVKAKKGGPRFSSHFNAGDEITVDGEVVLSGKIVSSQTRKPVDGWVDIFLSSDFISVVGKSAPDGEFTAPLADYGFYLISITAQGFIPTSDTLWVLNKKRKVIDKSFDVVPMEVVLTAGQQGGEK